LRHRLHQRIVNPLMEHSGFDEELTGVGKGCNMWIAIPF